MNGGLFTHAEFFRRGGQSKSEAKIKSALRNLSKAKTLQRGKRARGKGRSAIA